MAENTNEAWGEQQKTYAGFMKLTKWSIIGLAILVVALYFIIQP